MFSNEDMMKNFPYSKKDAHHEVTLEFKFEKETQLDFKNIHYWHFLERICEISQTLAFENNFWWLNIL